LKLNKKQEKILIFLKSKKKFVGLEEIGHHLGVMNRHEIRTEVKAQVRKLIGMDLVVVADNKTYAYSHNNKVKTAAVTYDKLGKIFKCG